MIVRVATAGSLLALTLAASPALADSTDAPWTLDEALGNPEGLKVNASVRARYEALGDQFRPGLDKNDDLVTIRTDVFAEYRNGPIRIGGELVDSRAYFGDPGSAISTGEVNAFEPIQAYVGADFGSAIGKGSSSSLDLGRFVLDLGSRRLVARNDFPNTTTAFTGARFQWRGAGKEKLTLFYTYPQQRLPDDKASLLDNKVTLDKESNALVFWGGLFTKPKIAGAANLDLYFFGLREKDCRLPRRIAAADDDDLLAETELGFHWRRAVVHAGAFESRDVVEGQTAVVSPCGDDDRLRPVRRDGVVRTRDVDQVARAQRARALRPGDLVLPEEELDPLRVRAHHFILALEHRAQVEPDVANLDAVCGGVPPRELVVLR